MLAVLSFMAGFLLIMPHAEAQESGLKHAHAAYTSLKFPEAIGLYERYLSFKQKRKEDPDPVVYAQLGKACWNIRDYMRAVRWLDLYPRQLLQSDSSLIRYRGELFAMFGQYDSAYAMLSRLSTFNDRAKGFLNRSPLYRDSASWSLGYALVNTPHFQEFSPFIANGSIIWSTNEPMSHPKYTVAGWDGKSMIRQAFLNEGQELGLTVMPNRSYDTFATPGRGKRLAQTFTQTENSLRSTGSFQRSSRSTIMKPNDLLYEPTGFSGLDFNVGHATFSPASRKIYFTANQRGRLSGDSIRTLGIVEASIVNGVVTKSDFLSLGVHDSIALHPAIHPKGHLLVYSAMIRGGRGDYDLYLSIKDTSGHWSSPTPVVSLNTTGNEVFANFDPEGILYFSSDGRPGLGGLDIHRAELTMDGSVKSVKTLPYPINSSFDDFGWMVIPGTNGRGYFTSNRYGTDDILGYSLRISRTRITGPVVDVYTGLRKSGIRVRIDSLTPDGNTRIPLSEAVTDLKGNYSFDVSSDRDYVVCLVDSTGTEKPPITQCHTVWADRDRSWVAAPPLFSGPKPDEKTGNANVLKTKEQQSERTDSLWVYTDLGLKRVSDLKSDPEKALTFSPGTERKSFIINFDFDSASIDVEAETIIQSLLSYLKTHPHASLMLQGHTDVEGSDDYNQGLSQRRSRNVRQRLMEMKYPSERIKTAYYGESLPRIQTRNKAEARMNRRVEVYILE